jgi:nicotinamidase-related amidase
MIKKALLVIDMLNDFCSPDGKAYHESYNKIIPDINEVIDSARKNDCLVIFVRHSYRKDKYDKNLENFKPICVEGTDGDKIIDNLNFCEKNDYVVFKRRYSAFFSTDLDLILRENNIKDLLITGIKTNNCIRATVHDSYYLDYNTFVIRECTASKNESSHEINLEDIDKYFGKVLSKKEAIDFLERGELL